MKYVQGDKVGLRLGWVDFGWLFHCLPDSDWAGGCLTELAELNNMVGHKTQSQLIEVRNLLCHPVNVLLSGHNWLTLTASLDVITARRA